MKLNILLVEDDQETLRQLERDLPTIFIEKNIEANIVAMDSFDHAFEAVQDPHSRFDLVISDTYRGQYRNNDAAVIRTVNEYKKGKFCPIVVYSSGSRPDTLTPSEFVRWADKGVVNDLDNQIRRVLEIGVPQIARTLHDQIDKAAGDFLWKFLDDQWKNLELDGLINYEILDRLVRRRTALILSDLAPGTYEAIADKFGLEYYVYPALDHEYFSLGDIVKCKSSNEFRVILTPHCHLFQHPGQDTPRAEFVLTVKTQLAETVLGDKLQTASEQDEDQQLKKLKRWATSPAQTEKKPTGRHWYLPKLLDIPHLFCDFLQLESVEYETLKSEYTRVATLLPPYAEAMQECFSSFYGSVGIPDTNTSSILSMIPTR